MLRRVIVLFVDLVGVGEWGSIVGFISGGRRGIFFIEFFFFFWFIYVVL